MDYSGPQTDPNDSTNTSRLDVQNCSIHSHYLEINLNSLHTEENFTGKNEANSDRREPSRRVEPLRWVDHLWSSPQEGRR